MLSATAIALADAPLTDLIPARAATTVVLTRVGKTRAELARFAREIGVGPDWFAAFGDVGERGIPGEAIDLGSPVALVYFEPGVGNERPVVVFRRVRESEWSRRFAAVASAPADGAIHRLTDGEHSLYVADRDGWTIAGRSRRDVRRLIRPRGEVLTTALTDDERARISASDAFVYVDVRAWQPRIAPILALMKLLSAASSQQNDAFAETNAAITDWFFSGTSRIIGEMTTVSIALCIDDAGFHVTHEHHFQPEGEVDRYVGSVSKTGGNPWRGIDDRPFLAAFNFAWQSSRDDSIARSMMNRLLASPGIKQQIGDEDAAGVLDSMMRLSTDMHGGAYVFSLTGDGHMQFVTQHRYDDARAHVPVLRSVVDRCFALAGVVLHGLGPSSTFEERRTGDATYFETKFDLEAMSREERIAFQRIYGPAVYYQFGATTDDLLTYYMGSDRDAWGELVRCAGKDRRTLASNPRIAELERQLAADRVMTAVVDLRAVAKLATRVVASSARTSERPATTAESAPPRPDEPQGPLLGWSVSFQPQRIRGEGHISRADAAQSVALFKPLFAKAAVARGSSSGFNIEVRTQRTTDGPRKHRE